MDREVMQDMWNDRYRESETVFGDEPNQFLVEIATKLDRGTALDLGCGQGRNALWLAERGFAVTGLDLSPVAIEQARARAAQLGLDATFESVDLLTWEPDGQEWDLVVLAYIHLPEQMRRAVHAAAQRAVAPGGSIVVIAHHLDNLGGGTGGPQRPDWLFTEEQLADDFSGLDIVRNEQVVRTTDHGDALDVVCVAVKKAT
ncbi:MAG: class I SAM-dependent methyltransferase [Acidimicrobiia bacterium]|jgi:2-polyprenyl-3-methyl-5-hydroxy-6-metoxy-1,4-benzoquinol methylase